MLKSQQSYTKFYKPTNTICILAKNVVSGESKRSHNFPQPYEKISCFFNDVTELSHPVRSLLWMLEKLKITQQV